MPGARLRSGKASADVNWHHALPAADTAEPAAAGDRRLWACRQPAALARERERGTGGKLEIQLEIDEELRGLPPTAASHVYRIVQEGLTNIGKHAKASQARVALGFNPGAAEQTFPSGAGWR